MVWGYFAAVGGLIKVRYSYTDVDSHVFRLHYRLTTAICFIACALVSATDFIGNPIQCMDGKDKVKDLINTYCWISSTFTINSTEDKGDIAGLGNEAGKEKTYHAYYQWVPFILFFQGCLFYLPHLLWKAVERKNAHTLMQGLDKFTVDPDIQKKQENMINHLKATRGQNWRYSLMYHIFELVNFVNVIGQMFLLDAFFGGAFFTYGTDVLSYALDDSADDPFRTVFPKMTKCTFTKYGPSGTIIKLQPLCVLPQNILNEKVFIFLWFWMVILATVSGMQLVWRAVVCSVPFLRVRLLERRGMETAFPALQSLERSIHLLHLGDYFLVEILGRNLDANTFNIILRGFLLDNDKDDMSSSLYPPLPSPDAGIDAIMMSDITH